jgi:NADPH:quinone reductase-like Zn-dependent oxidoreductase
LQAEPVVLGHEVALTVVGVGEALRDQFAVGQRYVVQAEIYHHGRNLAYGYMLQGGQSQYSVLSDPVLRGDDGCYLLPAPPRWLPSLAWTASTTAFTPSAREPSPARSWSTRTSAGWD